MNKLNSTKNRSLILAALTVCMGAAPVAINASVLSVGAGAAFAATNQTKTQSIVEPIAL